MPRFLDWGHLPPRYAPRPLLTLLLQIPGPCRRPVGHGELRRRGPPEPGRGEFSLLRLWQQPADGADPPPKPLGRVLQRGPPAGQCSPPVPCDGLCPFCRRGSQDFENSLSLRRSLAALGRECSSFCSKYIRVPCTTPGRSLSPSALCLTPAELCYSGTCASRAALRSPS